MWHRLAIVIVLLPAALSLGSAGTARGAESELLSKADAVRLFDMTKQQWVENVKTGVASGVARAIGSDPMPGMAMVTDEGDQFTVGVDYSQGDSKPVFIQITVGYRPERRPQVTSAMLKGVVSEAQRQMAPEFRVIGRVEAIEGGGVGVFFQILDQRRN